MNYRHLLFEVTEICERMNIKYCLCCGTAWALYRDGELFPDDDIDFYVFCDKQKLIELFKELMKNEFIPTESFQNEGWELNHHFFKYGLLCDIHYQFLKDEEKFFQELDVVSYSGKKFCLPHPIEEYLELNYGDWKNKTDGKCRPLIGRRKEFNGGPNENAHFDMNKYLQCEGRFEG